MQQGFLYEMREPNGRHLCYVSSKRPLEGPEFHLCPVAHQIKTTREASVVRF